MNRLYGMTDAAEGEEIEEGFSFDKDVLDRALKRIYSSKFHPLTEIEENLFNEFWRTFNLATNEGIAQSLLPGLGQDPNGRDFIDTLRHNNAVFAAFKTHRMQNDMATLLVDPNGDLKPFERWKKDVKPIATHQCRHWLQTEYDTAVRRAHLAADWQQFEREKDVLPNLRWMPSTSIHPGEDHRPYWNLVRPINDPFWNLHRPGDRWNCKCSLSSTVDPPTPIPSELLDVPTGPDSPHVGLDNNPGRDARLFSDTHPYVAHAYKCAKVTVEQFIKEREERNVTPPMVETYTDEYKGRVLCSPYHGANEKKANVEIATFIVKKLGGRIYLLPRLDSSTPQQRAIRERLLPPGIMEKKNPDFLINGRTFDAKVMKAPESGSTIEKIKNAIENHIKKAKKQADNIILELPTSVTRNLIDRTIWNYVERSNKERVVMVKHGTKLLIYKKRNKL